MSLTSKSPRMVTLAALAVGKEALPDYSHRFSPKVYTQPQLFACLVLMAFLRTDYRGIEQHLLDFAAYRDWLGLKEVPDHSTYQKAAVRFLGRAAALRLLSGSVKLTLGRRTVIPRAAADGTGLESGHRSPYFVQRKHRGQKKAKNPQYQTTTYPRFPKLTLLIDCAHHLVLGLKTARGPKPDMHDLPELLAGRPRQLTLLKVVADAGFDSEENHRYLRDEHGIVSVIPPKIGRPSAKPPAGRWRRRMRSLLRTKRKRRRCGYTQRWQVETVNSMLKRNLSDELFSRSYHAQCREMRLLVLTHNIMILIFVGEVFDRALQVYSRGRPFAPLHVNGNGNRMLSLHKNLNRTSLYLRKRNEFSKNVE